MEKMENNDVIVATNIIASQPPERRITGTPHARANSKIRSGPNWHISAFLLFFHRIFDQQLVD